MEKKFVIPELEIVFFNNGDIETDFDIMTVSDPAANGEDGSYDWN